MGARAAALTLVLAALAGCGSGDEVDPAPAAPPQPPPADPQPHAGESERLAPPRCSPAAAGCRSASGRIVYVEAVDPDGDGDAHFVLLSEQSITAPGISVIDVARDLRPHPLPGVGDLLSAAGPVQTGSYGQRQIEATKVRVGPIGPVNRD